MWDATPGHATPGHATPGRETPSHDKGASSRRNRWDETPKTERGILCAFSVKRKPEVEQFLVISLRKINFNSFKDWSSKCVKWYMRNVEKSIHGPM